MFGNLSTEKFILFLVTTSILIVLGFTVYSRYNKQSSTMLQNSSSQTSVSNPNQTAVSKPGSTTATTPAQKNAQVSNKFTNEKELPFNYPLNGTAQEKESWAQAVQSAAKTADSLTITSCIGTPLVIKIKPKDKLTIKNQDKDTHTLLIADKTYPISGNTSKDFTFDFFTEGGIYSYFCDRSNNGGGIIFSTAQ